MTRLDDLKAFLDSRRTFRTEVLLGIDFLDALIIEVERGGKPLCGVCGGVLGKRYMQITEGAGSKLYPGREYPLDVCEVCCRKGERGGEENAEEKEDRKDFYEAWKKERVK